MEILKGYFFMLLYKAGLVTDAKLLSVVGQRMLACKGCELRRGRWCSKRKVVSVPTGEKEMTPFGFEVDGYKTVRGCGCNLRAKVWTKSPCPLGKWDK